MRCFLLIVTWLSRVLYSQAQDGFVAGKPRLAYWQVESPQKQLVIVIHGGPAVHHEYLRPEFDNLQSAAKVVYYDQRGCGKSDTATSYVWQQQVDDLKRVIRTLAPKKKVFLAGSSWGSLLAMLYAYTYPEDVQGLILSGTIQWLGREAIYERTSFYPSRLLKQTISEKQLIAKLPLQQPVQFDTLLVTRTYELQLGMAYAEPTASLVSAPLAEHLKAIQVPILLIAGSLNVNQQSGYRYDWVDHYSQLLPKVLVQFIDQAGHDPWLSNPTLFFLLSNQFIKQNSN